MELKVTCDCGQKFKFDVEPVNGQMPFKLNCPVCNADATNAANAAIAEKLTQQPVVSPPPIAPVTGGLRIASSGPIPLPGMAPVTEIPSTRAATAITNPPVMAASQPKAPGEFNMGMGVLGALLGAGLGSGLMYGFFLLVDFRFPLMGTCIGLLTGLGARMLYKGRDSTLGGLSAGIAVLATCGTLFFMFGELQALYFISIGFSGYFAYRLAS